jgi:hypothetical protein
MSDDRLQRALTQVRTDLGVIEHEIEQWAGKPNKPPQATVKINSIIQALDPIWNVVFKKNPLNANAQPALVQWVQFKSAWNHGNGSWTECKEITQHLVLTVRAYRLQ